MQAETFVFRNLVPIINGGGLGLVALLVFKTSVAPNAC